MAFRLVEIRLQEDLVETSYFKCYIANFLSSVFTVFVVSSTEFRFYYRRIPQTLSSSISVTTPVAFKKIRTMLRVLLFAYQHTKNRDLPIQP
jgi:hypothetical protein